MKDHNYTKTNPKNDEQANKQTETNKNAKRRRVECRREIGSYMQRRIDRLLDEDR